MVEKEDLIDHLSGKSLINHILNYTSKMVKHQRHYIYIYFNGSGLFLELV